MAEKNPVEQLGYKSDVETVDKNTYCIEITCQCGQKRYIKKTDVFQVTKCKPCTFTERNQRRISKLAAKRKRMKDNADVVATAMENDAAGQA